MEDYVVNKFNRGEVDARALARDDFDKVINSAALVENFIPLRLGPMMFRPGLGYLGEVAGACYTVPFVSSMDAEDKAVLEFSNQLLRVWTGDELLTRTSVTSTLTNGDFSAHAGAVISNWTTDNDSGCTSIWITGDYAELTGTGVGGAYLYQTLTGVTDTNSEHAMRITILEAPVTVYIGTGGTRSSQIFKGKLDPGTHSLVFTPTADITITISNSEKYRALVEEIAFETTGTFTLPVDVTSSYLSTIRFRQSADVMFVAWGNGAQFKIERRGVKSWSVADYRANDGPFELINDTSITMTPGALSGTTTLTASAPYFTSDHVGSLFRVAAASQLAQASVTAEDTGTGGVRVVGVGNNRDYIIDIDFGTPGVGTITLQRSTDNVSWADMVTYTSDTSKTLNDGFDNAIYYYRLWCKTGDFTSGTIALSIFTASPPTYDGVCRVTGYTSTTVVSVQVLREFLSTDATRDWYEGSWSAVNGYPTAVSIHEGRLCWAGRTKVWMSVSDSYYSFDRELEGDSASISRTVGFGPVDNVNWLAETTRLLMGIASNVITVRSNSFGEILTPSNANLKSSSNQGAKAIDATTMDDRVYYAHRSGTRLMEADYRLERDLNESTDKTILAQNICSAGIRRVAVQMMPEKRIFVVLDDGEARVLTVEPNEDVVAWSRFVTDGTIEDVIMIPEEEEDRIYMVVKRDNGRFLEKLAKYSDADASATDKTLDSYVVTSGTGGTTVSGLAHMNGKTVKTRTRTGNTGSYSVSSGSTTVDDAVPITEDVVVGLPYTAKYTSNKLSGYVSDPVLSKLKRVVSSALIMSSYRDRSVTVGYNATTGQSAMPLVEDGTTFTTCEIESDYDEIPFEFDGDTETDPRVYIKSTGPCTILAMILRIELGFTSNKISLSDLGR